MRHSHSGSVDSKHATPASVMALESLLPFEIEIEGLGKRQFKFSEELRLTDSDSNYNIGEVIRQIAFWLAVKTKTQIRLEELELSLYEEERSTYLDYRAELMRLEERFSDQTIQAYVANDDSVKSLKRQVLEVKKMYQLLEVFCESVKVRASLLAGSCK